MERLPPLNALRAFEVAARHLSVTLAADELCVTPGAVSRKIRELEEFVDTPLFVRGHQQIALTAEGADYFKSISRLFTEVREATSRLGRRSQRQQLKIRAYSTFSTRWLIPRLSDFHDRYPEIEVSLTSSLEEVDFDRDEIDCAIRLGEGTWRGANSYWLVPNVICPVMSPKLPRADAPLNAPEDLGRYTLLHSLARIDDWGDWLRSVGETGIDPLGGATFQISSMAYAAAIRGQGIAMAQLFLIEDELRSGELVKVFDRGLERGRFTYYLLTPSDRPEKPQVTAFREWILARVIGSDDASA
ncbi:transcriptional regulator GcvA [Variovorax ginsengisoli]|uniref:Transcriptional regulator GcvA n=1 Tax=Variovorax ginsengisoli TaxID=363844 RepID=A0ABT8SEE3_9BURK|nr:transcriptional regulator GcvA [Variovorax ginsengisoli]MDN8617519.1 transcriptional regulator GcvA [Variovorax ginsengisoli]MDO1536689.1 transcriptional regulator GcvA [Variovorax ginsengisoli]